MRDMRDYYIAGLVRRAMTATTWNETTNRAGFPAFDTLRSSLQTIVIGALFKPSSKFC